MSVLSATAPGGTGPPSAGALWPQLSSLLRGRRGLLALAAGLVLLSALLELVPPLLMRALVDEHLTVGHAEGLLGLALLYLAATAAVEGVSAGALYLVAVAAQGALHDLRVRLLAHLQRLPISFYDQTSLGDVISRCTADVEAVETLFSTGAARVVADLARLATVAVAMVALSPPLALVSALVVPPLVGITRFFQVRVRAAERANRVAVGLLNSELQETLSGVEVIRAFDRQAVFVARFRGALRQTLAAFNRAIGYSAFYPPVTGTLAALATALLLWAGTAELFAAWGISLGTLTAFLLLFQRFFKPITSIGDEWQTVQGALSGAERIFQVLGLEADQDEEIGRPGDRESPFPLPPSPFPLARYSPIPPSGPPAAELDRVTFGYFPGRPVLRKVSLVVWPGEHVALVGRTGAGKSSLLHLLGGLYAPWSGRVRVLGLDPRQLAPDERRRLIGVVPQMVQLFSGTVLENLTLFDSEIDPLVVERAAALVGVDGLIRSLPRGYATPLTGSGRGSGAQLSAGQRQLLALARAGVLDPPLLLLDEATAAIDSASDAAFQAALRAEAQARRAVLTVAHRLATARAADRVLVLEAGRVVESGPPDELLRRGGQFAALCELEAAGWDWQSSLDGRLEEAGLPSEQQR